MSPRIWRWQLTEEQRRVHRWRQVTERAMGSEVVVDVAPVEVEDPCLEDGVEDLAIEELVAEPGVEALDEWVLPRATRLDVQGASAGESAPITNRARDQLRSVVHPDAFGGAALGLGLVEHVDHIL